MPGLLHPKARAWAVPNTLTPGPMPLNTHFQLYPLTGLTAVLVAVVGGLQWCRASRAAVTKARTPVLFTTSHVPVYSTLHF